MKDMYSMMGPGMGMGDILNSILKGPLGSDMMDAMDDITVTELAMKMTVHMAGPGVDGAKRTEIVQSAFDFAETFVQVAHERSKTKAERRRLEAEHNGLRLQLENMEGRRDRISGMIEDKIRYRDSIQDELELVNSQKPEGDSENSFIREAQEAHARKVESIESRLKAANDDLDHLNGQLEESLEDVKSINERLAETKLLDAPEAVEAEAAETATA